MRTITKAATLVTLVLAAACASDKSKTDTGTEGGTSGTSSSPYQGPVTSPATTGATGKPTATSPGAGANAPMPTARVLYFDFDKSDLTSDAATLAAAWAAYLAANPSAKVRLEGHTDERGTREYNVALGERRGNAVLQALTARGVSERQVSVTSFGEERPVALGHDEAAWAQNRRVEVVQ